MGLGEEPYLGLGLTLASCLSLSLATLGVVWGRRRGAQLAKRQPYHTTKTPVRGEADFGEISQVLEDSLRGRIGERVEGVRGEMKVKRLQLERMVGEVRRKEEEELSSLRERQRREREEVEARYCHLYSRSLADSFPVQVCRGYRAAVPRVRCRG